MPSQNLEEKTKFELRKDLERAITLLKEAVMYLPESDLTDKIYAFLEPDPWA